MRRADFIATSLVACALPNGALAAAQNGDSLLEVRVVTDEADAALAVALADPVADALVARLMTAEGYVRLKAREASLKRDINDAEFVAFLRSAETRDRVPALQRTLDTWKRADLNGAAARTLAYLPPGSTLRASIYLEIKPRTNSFVFDLDTNPGIFLYLDPAVDRPLFENTIAHELHHVGNAQNCPPPSVRAANKSLSAPLALALEWLSAFGEGFAVLAAAGGPDVHPHAVDKPEAKARWDHDVADWRTDLVDLVAFFEAILDQKLTGDAARTAGFKFFGDAQGPWYTVGWSMATRIERRFGRARLVECICDVRQFIPIYNASVRATPNSTEPLWPNRIAQVFAPR
jgi:hypothetical protein